MSGIFNSASNESNSNLPNASARSFPTSVVAQTAHIEVPFSSQISDVVETEALLHEPVSQSVENFATSSISNEQIGEFTTSSESNEPICEGVIGEVELSIEGVPRNEMSALYGSGHQPSLNAHYSDPIEFELGKTIKEKEELERSHLNMEAQLKSNCEKEIEEMTNQIKQKYKIQFQVAEAEFRQERSKLDNYLNKLQNHKKLAEAVRNKFEDPRPPSHPVNQQGTSSVIPNALNFQPSPGHLNTSFAGPPVMQHQSLAHPCRISQITNHSVTAPSVHIRSHPNDGSVRPCIRPPHSLGCPGFSPVTRYSVTAPSVHFRSNPNDGSVRPCIRPPHSLGCPRCSPVTRHSVTAPPVQQMQGFVHHPPRPRQVTSVMPSHSTHASGVVSSVAAQRHQLPSHSTHASGVVSSQCFRPCVGLPTSSQNGLLAETTTHLSTLTMRERRCWSCLQRPNYTYLGVGGVGSSNDVPGNRSSSSVAHDDVNNN